MKKALLMILMVIMIAALPATSYAANEMDTVLTYTVAEPSAPSDPGGTYTVVIPSTINLNERTDFAIQAEDVSLADNKKVVVTVEAQTFNGDAFYLYKDGTDAAHRILCYLYHSQNPWDTEPYAQISTLGDVTVAEFKNADTVSRKYGRIFVLPMLYSDDIVPGTYSGTIYFKISVKDD